MKWTRFVIAVVAAAWSVGGYAAGKMIAGWSEPVRISPGNTVIQAKLDTGATTSSLDCDCDVPQTRNGKLWVKFGVRKKDGQVVRLEREVVRFAKIKRHFGRQQERPVVRLGLCLASVFKEVDVTLVDRTGFNYPLLVGRNFLKGDVLVDAELRQTTTPTCTTESQ